MKLVPLLIFLPSIFAQCDVCPDGSDVVHVDRVLPALILDENRRNPTCGDYEAFVRSSATLSNCDLVHDQAGYCGCPGIEPIGGCSLCSNGAVTPQRNKLTPEGDTCGDIETYISFLSEEACQTTRGENLREKDFLCGCPGAIPVCELCPDGDLPDPDLQVFDGKCGEIEDIVKTFNQGDCDDSERFLQLNRIRCGCGDETDFPECSILENPNMCTEDLLSKVSEECECYNFCDDAFLGCVDFPGTVVRNCPGVAIGGCNSALARRNSGSGAIFLDVPIFLGFLAVLLRCL